MNFILQISKLSKVIRYTAFELFIDQIDNPSCRIVFYDFKPDQTTCAKEKFVYSNV